MMTKVLGHILSMTGRHIMTAIMVIGGMAFVGCTDEGYDTGDSDLSYVRQDYVEMVLEKGTVKSITKDDDSLLPFSGSLGIQGISNDTIIRRLLTYKQVKDGDAITPLSTKMVTTITPTASWKVSPIKDDPVKVSSIWWSKNRRYLNINLGVMTGTADDENMKQTITILRDTLITEGNGKALLRVYHDQCNVPQYYTSDVYLSIPTANMPVDTIEIVVPTYSGEYRRMLLR